MLEMDANILIFALIAINIILMMWVKIPVLQLLLGVVTVVLTVTITDSSVFPWLNLTLVVIATYGMLEAYNHVW